MKEYTIEGFAAEKAALEAVFDRVCLVDARRAVLLDPATLEPVGDAPALPTLNEKGRGVQLLCRDKPTLMLCQAATVAGISCVICIYTDAAAEQITDTRELESFSRAVNQYQQDLRRDYVTNAYNSRYLETEYRRYAERCAASGQKVGVVLACVNEYEALSTSNPTAADCCLNTAAGILQLAIGMDSEKAVLCRLEGGLFLIVTVGATGRTVADTVREALSCARREFNLSLSRRGNFTVAVAAAEWAETSNWDMLLSLAQERLTNC